MDRKVHNQSIYNLLLDLKVPNQLIYSLLLDRWTSRSIISQSDGRVGLWMSGLILWDSEITDTLWVSEFVLCVCLEPAGGR